MHGQLAREFAQTALHLRSHCGLHDVIEVVLGLAAAGVSCRHVSLVLRPTFGSPQLGGATDPLAEAAGQLQLALDAPYVDLLGSRATLRIDDISEDQRWPLWSSQMAELGLRSVLITRIDGSATPIGELNLYDESPRRFTPDSAAIAEIVAGHASSALTHLVPEHHRAPNVNHGNLLRTSHTRSKRAARR